MYNLVFACDVFCYIGDLDSIFISVKKSIVADGMFAFSTECLEESHGEEKGFILHQSARFAHKRSYIESLAIKHSFRVLAIKTCPIRKNEGEDVKGILAILS